MSEVKDLPEVIFSDETMRSFYVNHDSALFMTTYDKEFELLFFQFAKNYTAETNLKSHNFDFKNTDVIVLKIR